MMTTDNHKIDRSELAIWAEGTQYTTDELANMYGDYRLIEIENGREPLDEGRWANEVVGISNE